MVGVRGRGGLKLPSVHVPIRGVISENRSKPGTAEQAKQNGGFMQTDNEVESQICRLTKVKEEIQILSTCYSN